MRTALSAVLLVAALAASAAEDVIVVQGTPVPTHFPAAGKVLLHNGSGVRTRYGFAKVYVGTLYLEPNLRKDASEIVAADEPKAVRLVFLRDVSKDDVMKAFREGFENNSPDQLAALTPRLDELAKAIPGKVKEKQILTFVYEPGKGTTVAVEGGPPPVTVQGKDFADALLRNWIGPKPADDGLKKRMLAG